jgi:hypothetical protein
MNGMHFNENCLSIQKINRTHELLLQLFVHMFQNQLVIQIQKNQKRAALVWLDEYYDYFFKYHTEANTLDPGDGLEERMALRKNLKSLPFAWYPFSLFLSYFQSF